MRAPLTTRLVLVSRADPASTNIRDALLDMHTWDDAGSFHGLPVRKREGWLLAEISEVHVEADGVDVALREAGHAFDVVLVASKHRAASGKPALTVHPIGNLGNADVGGKPRALVPAAPTEMARVLARLAEEARALKHEATFEATHHGPFLQTPTAFVEIGTDESSWSDADLGERVARAILAAGEPGIADAAPTLLALGGSHYAPRATDLARKGRARFGHIVPTYAIEAGLDARVLYDAVRLSADCAGYYADPRTMDQVRPDAMQVFSGLELGWFRDEDL